MKALPSALQSLEPTQAAEPTSTWSVRPLYLNWVYALLPLFFLFEEGDPQRCHFTLNPYCLLLSLAHFSYHNQLAT